MKKPRFRLWIASISFCRYRRDAPNPRLCVLPAWHAFAVRCVKYQNRSRPWKDCGVTPAATSWPSWKKSRLCARSGSGFISSSTIFSAHKTQLVRDFLQRHSRVQFHFTPTIPRGSTKSSCGSPKSSARSLPAVSLLPSRTWLACSAATSALTPPTHHPSAGNTRTLLAAHLITNSPR